MMLSLVERSFLNPCIFDVRLKDAFEDIGLIENGIYFIAKI